MSATPNLKSKCWHLNTYIKRLIFQLTLTGTYYIDPSKDTNLIAPNSDAMSDGTFIFRSGKGVITGHNLDLAQDND